MVNKIKYSFKQFCEDTNNYDLLNLWDNEKNSINPDSVSASECKKYWFKCPKGIHDSNYIYVNNIVRGYKTKGSYCMCHACNSIGQFIKDNYGKEYLDRIWSDKNTKSPFEIEYSSKQIIWLKCQNDKTHPDYDLSANNFHKSHSCPYCINKRVCTTNSFAYKYPDFAKYWSDKNLINPDECVYTGTKKYYFKCENGIHKDYLRSPYEQAQSKYLCPVCGVKKRIEEMPRGADSPYWKGDAVEESRRARDTWIYDDWRRKTFEKDQYTCQCCGIVGGRLNAHHIENFSSNKKLRYDIQNGITLCEEHHSTAFPDSFHKVYGTKNNNGEQLEEYINLTRKSLGIDISFSLKSYLDGNIIKPGDIEDQFEITWIFDLFKDKNESNHAKIVV